MYVNMQLGLQRYRVALSLNLWIGFAVCFLISKYLYIKLVVIVFIKRRSRVEKDFLMSEFNGIAISKVGGELVSYF